MIHRYARSALLPIPLIVASGVLAFGLGLAPTFAGPGSAGPGSDAMQVMADIVLIESRCSALNVDYGRAFAFLRRHGIEPVDIMPTGVRRSEFDTAYRRRAAGTDDARLCNDLAVERQSDVPGVFTAR